MVPETRYAQSDGVSIAYETPAHRPNDLVLVPGWVSNLDNHWEQPAVENFYRRLALLSRLILFASRTSTPVKRLRGRAST